MQEPEVVDDEELRETLKSDVMHNFHEITATDFKDLLTLFRSERDALRGEGEGGRDGQPPPQQEQRSLWEILAERRQQTDQHIHDGEAVSLRIAIKASRLMKVLS